MFQRKGPILLRPELSPKVGLGHFSRCRSIAESLVETGEKAIFLLPSASRDLLPPDLSIPYIEMKNGSVEESIEVASRNKASGILFDSYEISKSFYDKLRAERASLPTFIIDDYAEKKAFACHSIIHFGIGERANEFSDQERRLGIFGPTYFPLRKDSRELQPKEFDKENSRLLLSLGGGDPEKQYPRLIHILLKQPELKEIWVQLGPLFEDKKAIQKEFESEQRLQFFEDSLGFPKRMRDCDVALCAGGGTAVELCYFGRPMLIVSLSRDQKDQAESLQKKAAALHLGHFSQITDQDISDGLQELLENTSLRESLSQNAKNLIDGQGSFRLCLALSSRLDSYHRDLYSIDELSNEYETAADSPEEFEKVKWGSQEGMINRFRLGKDKIDWRTVHTWLDIGCGTGGFLRELGDQAKEISFLGLDLSPKLLEFAKSQKTQSLASEFKHLSFLEEIEGAPFDLVTALGVLQKCGVSLQKAICRMAELTRPGGKLFFTTKHLDWIRFKRNELQPETGHHWFSSQEIKDALFIAGLEIEEFTGFEPREGRLCQAEDSHSILVVARRLPE